ncbi:hypothetical protein EUX98_g4395 [Antrodiella citrinella]|uniref:Methionine aminopeptidase n=1 Tax=Antrodiella citrinella TaxID=2447956 RepID=A0A4S4N236_9APHY|nr:hypothetical protein EUX98_g4395 [Antrodiella citrinella]
MRLLRSFRPLYSSINHSRTRISTLSKPLCRLASGSAVSPALQEADEDLKDVEVQDPGFYDVILPPEPYVFGTSHITPLLVPRNIVRPSYVKNVVDRDAPHPPEQATGDGLIALGTGAEVRLRAAARLAKKTVDYAGTLVRPGITTEEIDAAVHGFIVGHNAYPSPLLYKGFPKACCTSVNNVVTHGIPDDRPLQNGDIVNIDVTVYLDGYHGDTSRTFTVGEADDIAQSLIATTSAALRAATLACGPGKPFRGIASAIHDTILTRGGHWTPWIIHELNNEPGSMQPGHCFTIEPCIIQGTDSSSWTFPDGWTASTVNAARSAQEEDMILITETGFDVLTRDGPIA